jgi:MFS family permease
MSKDTPAERRGVGEPEEQAEVVPVDVIARLREGFAAVRVMGRGVIGRFSVTQALIGFGAGIFFPYVNLYIVTQLGGSARYFGVLNAAYTVLLAVASLVSAPLADRFGKVRASVAAQAASLPLLLLAGAVPVLWVVSVAYLARGFLINLTGAPLQAYLMEAVPERTRVAASGVYNVSFQAAGALGAGAGGLLIQHAGYQASFFVAAPFYALSAFLLAVWFGTGRASAPADVAA